MKKSARKLAKKIPPLMWTKSLENPIIEPRAEHPWETRQVFNPGAVLLEGRVHILYRAIGVDGISRLGYAASSDGVTIDERLSQPVYEHSLRDAEFSHYSFASGGSWGGCEDPRIVRVGDEDTLYMTYTACDAGLRVGLTSIKIDDFLAKRWRWQSSKLISPPGEVHKNWVIFPEKINGRYAILHSISPEISISYMESLDFYDKEYISSYHDGSNQRENCWDTRVRGAGPPPIKTKDGWLLFYHAIDDLDPGKYKVGAMLLDLKDPTNVLQRLKEPALQPSEVYENNGFKPGVVYVSGAVVKDGNFLLYYGGADSVVCVATAPLDGLLSLLIKAEGVQSPPSIRRKHKKKISRK